ncbi:MAG: MinD/ParA family protein [Planctomycetota bacterium]
MFAVTSGKGGVGKTSISVNLGIEFARQKLRTIVVDADLGLANTHIVAGVKPTRSLSDYLDGEAELVDIIVPGPMGVKFISGGSGVKEMANLDEAGRQHILDAVLELRPFCDVIILDTAAGISRSVTDFVSVSDHTLVVTTPDFAAIADAYGIIKTLVQEKVSTTMHLLVNRVRSPDEAEQVCKKLKDCAQRFLGFDLNWLGLVPEDHSVETAVVERRPFSEVYPDSVVARYVRRAAETLARLVPADAAPRA